MPVFCSPFRADGTTLMVTYQVERAVAGEPRTARRRPGFLGCDANVAYTFIAPASFLLIILVAYPFALSVWLSLSDAAARTGPGGGMRGRATNNCTWRLRGF